MKYLVFLSVLLMNLVSIDEAGAQWVQLPGPEGGYLSDFERIGSQIWVTGNPGLYISDDEALTWHKSNLINENGGGIFKKNDSIILFYSNFDTNYFDNFLNAYYCRVSLDGGMNWSPQIVITAQASSAGYCIAKSSIIREYEPYLISYDFGQTWSNLSLPYGNYIDQFYSDNNTFLIECYNLSNPGEISQSYISTDAGHTWQLINSSMRITSFFVKDSLVLLTIQDNSTTPYQIRIVRSNDLTTTWDTVFIPPLGENYSTFESCGENIFLRHTEDTILMSSDLGMTWSYNLLSSIPQCTQELALSHGDKLGFGNMGLQRFDSISNSYLPANNGICGFKINYLGTHNNVLYASSDFVSFRSADAGQTWQPLMINEPPLYDITGRGDTIFGLTGTRMERSFDNGLTWDTLCPLSPYYNMEYWCAIEFDGQRLYLTTDGMYYSDDFGLTWSSLPALPANQLPPCEESATAKGKLMPYKGELFCLTELGSVYKYLDTLQNWEYLTCFPAFMYSGNAFYPLDSSLVIFGDDLLYTNDLGQSWIFPACNGLDFTPHSFAAIGNMWFTKSFKSGVFVSTDKGENWQPIQTGPLPFHAYGTLVVMNGVLYSGSINKGIWRRTGNFEVISGSVYLDANNNGTFDTNEVMLPNSIVQTRPNPMAVSTDSNGVYTLITDSQGDTLSLVRPNPYALSNPPYYLTNEAATDQDFGVYMPDGIKDLTIDMTNTNVFQPGFGTLLTLTAKNNGSVKQPAILEVLLDSNLIFVNAVPGPYSFAGNQFTWITDSLTFMESRSIQIEVTTNIIAMQDDSIKCRATVLPVIHDTVSQNNYSTLADIVKSSYDPNDKECIQGEYLTTEQITSGQELTYIIRFQNTGNYQTSFIHVTDTLCHYFDVSTFHVISTSHPLTWSIRPGNVIDFYFEDAHLSSAEIDELNSCGFVKFGIKCKAGVGLGNALTNTAYIYFDYNPAIITNTTATMVVNPFFVSIPEDYKDQKEPGTIVIYPNPTDGELNIDYSYLGGTGTHLMIFNTTGSLVLQEKIIGKRHTINMNNYPKGLYLGILSDPSTGKRMSFKFVLR